MELWEQRNADLNGKTEEQKPVTTSRKTQYRNLTTSILYTQATRPDSAQQ